MKKKGSCELKIRSRKSQITIFIILGIIIVISMGLLFAANIKEEYSPSVQDTKVKEFVVNCLEKATNDGLELIGKQGGKLNFDNHDYSLSDGIDYNGYEVPYGIKRSEIDNFHPSGERYPYPGKLIRKPDELTIKNYFGNYVKGFDDHLSFLTPLCSFKESSPNWLWNVVKKSCETYGFNGNSVQDYLQEFINEKIKECDVDSLEEKYGYEITKEDMKVEVLMGNDDLKISLEYPLTIKSGKSKIELSKFSYNPQVRLKKIHEFASHLIGYRDTGLNIKPRGDVTDLFFDITSHYKSLKLGCRENKIKKVSCWKQGFKIKKEYNLGRNYGADDLIKITDEKSIVNGKPFVFQFAIQNRQPVLDYIAPVNVGGTIKIKGYDPDDGDILRYNWYLDSSVVSTIKEYTYTSGTELIAEVCDNAGLCDSQTVKIIS